MLMNHRFFRVFTDKSVCEDGSQCYYLPAYSKFDVLNEYIIENNLSAEETSSILLYYAYIFWNVGRINADGTSVNDLMEKRTDKEIPENIDYHLTQIIERNNQRFSEYLLDRNNINFKRSRGSQEPFSWEFKNSEKEFSIITQGFLDVYYDGDSEPKNVIVSEFNSGEWQNMQHIIIPNRKYFALSGGHISIFRVNLVGLHNLSDYNVQVIKLSEGGTETVSRPIVKNTRVFATTIREVAPSCVINSVDYTHEPFVPELTFSPGETLEVSLTSVNNVKNSIFLVFVEEKQ